MMKDGVILYDPATVEIDESKSLKQIAVPAKDTAVEKLGRPIYANIVMLGALSAAAADVLDKQVMLETMLGIIPKFKDENKKAFELGFSMVAAWTTLNLGFCFWPITTNALQPNFVLRMIAKGSDSNPPFTPYFEIRKQYRMTEIQISK